MQFYSTPMHELVRTIIHKSLCVIIAHFIRYYKQSETYTEDKQTSSKLTSLQSIFSSPNQQQCLCIVMLFAV